MGTPNLDVRGQWADLAEYAGCKVARLDGYHAADLLDCERHVKVRASGITAEVIGLAPEMGIGGAIIRATGGVCKACLEPHNCYCPCWTCERARLDRGYPSVRPVTPSMAGAEGFGEPIRIDIAECVPLCVHCFEVLYESAVTGPGVCLNPECFLYDPSEYPALDQTGGFAEVTR